MIKQSDIPVDVKITYKVDTDVFLPENFFHKLYYVKLIVNEVQEAIKEYEWNELFNL